LPTTTTTKYSALLAPRIVEEVAGGVTRTTMTTYLADGRVSTVTVDAPGLAGSAPVKGTKTVYDDETGLPTQLVQLDANGNTTSVKQVASYDGWGRPTSYTASGESVATTTAYDSASRVNKVTDPKGTTEYFYDGDNTGGTDVAGNVEHRGLVTQLKVSNAGGNDAVFKAAYNAAGALVQQNLPGSIIQRMEYNSAGDQTKLTYSGLVTSNGVSTPDTTWLAWSQDRDGVGRIRQEWTPLGSAFSDGAATHTPSGSVDSGDAIAYDRQYLYDQAGRLIQVDDRTARATGAVIDPDHPETVAAVACKTRLYEFDRNGNRTKLTNRDATAQTCATSGGAATDWTYNAADQLTARVGDGSYAYDGFGRATTIPAVDTPGKNTDLAIGYYDTDAVHTISQQNPVTHDVVSTTTYSLDVAGRRQDAVTEQGSTTTTLERHYADGSDNPGWTVEETSSGSTTTRIAGSLGPGTPVQITNGAITLNLANPHGDTVTTIDVPATGPATSITGWSDFDEYGNPVSSSGPAAVGAGGYKWLGGLERATDETGLILMGARLYNPATGVFTSQDPILGGNETAYSYPADPINSGDPTGLSQDPAQYSDPCTCDEVNVHFERQPHSYMKETDWVSADDIMVLLGGAAGANLRKVAQLLRDAEEVGRHTLAFLGTGIDKVYFKGKRQFTQYRHCVPNQAGRKEGHWESEWRVTHGWAKVKITTKYLWFRKGPTYKSDWFTVYNPPRWLVG
jgi:RHS repeat-associated protein